MRKEKRESCTYIKGRGMLIGDGFPFRSWVGPSGPSDRPFPEFFLRSVFPLSLYILSLLGPTPFDGGDIFFGRWRKLNYENQCQLK